MTTQVELLIMSSDLTKTKNEAIKMKKDKKSFDAIMNMAEAAILSLNVSEKGTPEYYEDIKKKEDLIFSLIANGFVDLSK